MVPIDQLGIARVADDGSHLRVYVGWVSPEIGAPAIEWAQRLRHDARGAGAAYPRGAHRVCSDTRLSTSPLELAVAEVGILSTISVPIGDPLQGIVGFGFRASEMLRDEHLPLFRQIAAMLLDRLDWSLLAAHAARLGTITEAMPMGAIMLARDGTVEEVNPEAARMLGRDARELRGRLDPRARQRARRRAARLARR